MNIGARTIKTGIAVALAIYIVELLELSNPSYAGVAAFLAIQPTVYRSWKTFLEQMGFNIVGALFAVLALLTIGNNPLTIGVVVVSLIALNYRLGISNMGISVLTAIIILEIDSPDILIYAGERIVIIMTGILSSLLINVTFFPPKYEQKLYHHILTTSEQLSLLLRTIVYNTLEPTAYENAKKTARKNIEQSETLYSLYKDEFQNKKKQYSKTKKLVAFSHLIAVIQYEYRLVEAFERYRKWANLLSNEEKHIVQRYLYTLTSYDEHIFMSYKGDIRTSQTHVFSDDLTNLRDTMKRLMLEKKREELVLLYASLLTLEQELHHTQRLISYVQKKPKASPL